MRRKVEQEDKEKDEENEVGGVKSSGVGQGDYEEKKEENRKDKEKN